MLRRDWLLLVIGDQLEPIQIQKALFKFSKESGADTNELYQFEPYNWGPCSFDVYSDLSDLREQGLIDAVPSGRGWSFYSQTDIGRRLSAELRERASPPLLASLDQIRQFVTDRPFEALLRDVYSDYPEYAAKSLFQR